MKRYVAALLALTLVGCEPGQDKKPELKDQKDKLSYVIGTEMGMNFKEQMIDVNPKTVAYALDTALQGKESLLSKDEMQQVKMDFQKEMMEKQKDIMAKKQQESEVAGKKNAELGEKFLAENKKKDGVKTLPSGLQYKILKAGKGAKPKATEQVVAHYRGTLIDGTEFDSSIKRGEPATFPLNRVIPGWTEALQLMPLGSKWELYIPSHLAYGKQAPPGSPIGPDSVLIFEVELLDIKK